MHRTLLAALAALAVAVVCIGVALVSGKPSTVVLVRHVKTVASSGAYTFAFEITNCSAQVFQLLPGIEVQEGSVWNTSHDVAYFNLRPRGLLVPHAAMHYSFGVTNLPLASHLRLRILGEKELVGPAALFNQLNLQFLYVISVRNSLPTARAFDHRNPIQLFCEDFVPPPIPG